mmetsp:Transcript_3640/g.3587  ORF Transcript_3640/g.3587 Transcript_3640/m.3587 type:complete len:113 (+) Transcript_3640:310-648(+)
MLQRLQSKQSTYNVVKMEIDEFNRKKLLSNLREVPGEELPPIPQSIKKLKIGNTLLKVIPVKKSLRHHHFSESVKEQLTQKRYKSTGHAGNRGNYEKPYYKRQTIIKKTVDN